VKRAFISDCEGPISKNDNAYELTAHYVPNGNKLFTIISRYDDVLAEVVKKLGYKAGDTVKLILPFLKAYGVTDQKMEQFSAKTLLLIPDAKETLRHVRTVADTFIVSTSYEHYAAVLCHALDFPFKNAYCTRLRIDEYALSTEEEGRLRKIAQEIAHLPAFDLSPEAKSPRDLPQEVQNTIQQLDMTFWKEIADMKIGKIFSEINPMGGREKAEAIKDITKRQGIQLSDVMYVGDSITDEQAFRLVSENGGLAVSFNGNQYAVKNAQIAILSDNSIATGLIADVFCRSGKQQALSLAGRWTRETLNESTADQALLNRMFELHPRTLPKVRIVTRENIDVLAEESSRFRKKVRGEAVGRLG